MRKIPVAGERIRLDYMEGIPPIPIGTEGRVVLVLKGRVPEKWMEVEVAWDDGRQINLICPPDRFTILEKGTNDTKN